MHIVIDAHSIEGNPTGVGRYLSNLIKEWIKKGNDNPALSLMFKEGLPQDQIIKNWCQRQKTCQILNKFRHISSNTLYTHLQIPLVLHSTKADVAFFPGYVMPLWQKTELPSVVTIHDIVFEARPELYEWPSPLDRLLLKQMARWSARRARMILVPSAFTKEQIIKYYGISENKIAITPLGVDQQFFVLTDGEKQKARQRLKKHGINGPYILYAGAVIKRRFPFETLEAFYRVNEVLAGLQLVFAGPINEQIERPFSEEIKKINKLLNRKAVIHKSYLDNSLLRELYNCAEVFVWCSEYEGFGLPPLEAAACGALVAVSPQPALKEVLANAAVYIKEPSLIAHFADLLYESLTNQTLRRVKKAALLKRSQMFSWQHCAYQTLEILKQAAHG